MGSGYDGNSPFRDVVVKNMGSGYDGTSPFRDVGVVENMGSGYDGNSPFRDVVKTAGVHDMRDVALLEWSWRVNSSLSV